MRFYECHSRYRTGGSTSHQLGWRRLSQSESRLLFSVPLHKSPAFANGNPADTLCVTGTCCLTVFHVLRGSSVQDPHSKPAVLPWSLVGDLGSVMAPLGAVAFFHHPVLWASAGGPHRQHNMRSNTEPNQVWAAGGHRNCCGWGNHCLGTAPNVTNAVAF